MEVEVEGLSRIAQIMERQNRSTDASEMYAKALALIESSRESLGELSEHKLGFQNAVTPLYQRYISLQLRRNRIETAFEWTQKSKARVLIDLMASGRVKLSQAMTPEDKKEEATLLTRRKELSQQWLAAEGQLEELKLDTKSSPERLKQGETRLQEIKRQQQELEREWRVFHDQMYSRNPRLAHQRAARTATFQEAAAVLADDTALLEYCFVSGGTGQGAGDEVALFVVTRANGRPRLASFKSKYPLGSVAKLSSELRDACSARPGTSAEQSYQGVSRQLYDALIAPAAHLITGKKRLIICPDGPLWDVP